MERNRPMSIEVRVRRLERANRTLAFGLCIVSGLIIFLGAAGAEPVPDDTALYIKDGDGTTRIGVAQFAHGGGGFALHGEESKGAAVLYLKGVRDPSASTEPTARLSNGSRRSTDGIGGYWFQAERSRCESRDRTRAGPDEPA